MGGVSGSLERGLKGLKKEEKKLDSTVGQDIFPIKGREDIPVLLGQEEDSDVLIGIYNSHFNILFYHTFIYFV